jgi:hypothetical protein
MSIVSDEPVDLRALRDEREAARDRIGSAYAEGLLDADELDRRMEALESATTHAEVRQLVADLGGATMVPAKPSALAVRDDVSGHEMIKAVFAETTRRGVWKPALTNDVKSIFASATIDLREATLPAGETIFDVDVIFGEVEIIVPPGMPVAQEVSVYFASIEEDEEVGEHPAGHARIRIMGRAIFGSVSILRRLPGESRREAKRRRKQERKRLEGARQRALPGR